MTSRGVQLVSACVVGVVLIAGPAGGAEGPAGVYDQFNKFCLEHFGAETEPEVYRMFGKDVKIAPAGRWSHVSETSACFAWETNLPARGRVEYGPTATYTHKTPEPERPFSLHLHHLRGLKPNTTYHYRLVATDERGKTAATADATFTTRRAAGAVSVPGEMPGPPYVLDKANTTYVVTKDIVADGTAIFLAASGITLDVGGHTVTYDQKRDTANQGACGIRGHKRRGIGLSKVRVVNGTVRRGSGGSGTRKLWDTLYCPLFFSRPSELEIAGLTVEYHGVQVLAQALLLRGQKCSIHHNSFLDAGTTLVDRHIGIDAISLGAAESRCHHNLIRRTRHRGIKALPGNDVCANEIYVDSHATNSYGIMYYAGRDGGRDLALHHNRIFGTGYHPVGIGSGQGYSDVKIHANYIQVQGTPPEGRWRGGRGGGDSATQLHPVNGIRLQSPGKNVEHYDNTIVAKGRGAGCLMRGLWLVPGAGSGPGLVFRNNRVKLIAQDDKAEGYAISAGGAADADADATVQLVGNTIISNLCHVQFGDNYSHGGRHVLTGNRFVKVGDESRYRTIRLGWRGWKYGSFGHVFIDSAFEGGAGYESVSFDGGRSGRYDFSVGWPVEVRTAPGAKVSVKDKTGQEVFSGQAPPSGKIAAALIQYVRTRAGRAARTPHTVTVEKDGKTTTKQVTADRKRTIEIGL